MGLHIGRKKNNKEHQYNTGQVKQVCDLMWAVNNDYNNQF